MATGLRLGYFAKGGQFVESVDLESTEFLKLAEGGFSWTPGAATPISVAGGGRFDGSVDVGDLRENGIASCAWAITGADADAALQNLETLIVEADRGGRAKWLEVRPEGASRASYLRLRGAGAITPKFAARLFEQNDAILVDGAFACAPLAYGPPCDVLDEFDVDRLADDWTFDTGAAGVDLAVTGGVLDALTTGAKQLRYIGRGYTHADVEVTVKVVTSSTSVTGANYGVILKWIDASNFLYVEVDQTSGNLRIRKCDGGVHSSLATTARALATNTTYYVRGRIEAGVVYAEAWVTTTPTPIATPTTSTSHTLAGGDATKFGAGVEGGQGLRVTPAHAADTYDDFTVRPWTYRNRSLPAATPLQLGGEIPGTENSEAGFEVTTSGGTQPAFACIGWTGRPSAGIGGSRAPHGSFDMNTEDVSGDRSGWASSTSSPFNGGYGGGMLGVTAAGATTCTASVLVDPSAMVDADDFDPFTLLIEVWARVLIDDGLIAPTITVSHRPEQGTNFGSEVFTYEFGSSGRLLTVPSGASNCFRKTRLGVLPFVIDPDYPARRKIWISGVVASGSNGAFGLDLVDLKPARSRCLSPSGKPLDSTYPKFVYSTSETTKLVRHDLSGRIASPPNAPDHDHGLTGSRPELPAGEVDVSLLFDSLVPDDPTSSSSSGVLTQAASLHVPVQPRYRHLRP